jgi:hypothetical protein
VCATCAGSAPAPAGKDASNAGEVAVSCAPWPHRTHRGDGLQQGASSRATWPAASRLTGGPDERVFPHVPDQYFPGEADAGTTSRLATLAADGPTDGLTFV